MQNIRWGHIGAGFVFGIVVNWGVRLVSIIAVSVVGLTARPGVMTGVSWLAFAAGLVTTGYHITRKTYPHGLRNLIALWCALAVLIVGTVALLLLTKHGEYVTPGGALFLAVTIPGHLAGYWIDAKRNHQVTPPPIPR